MQDLTISLTEDYFFPISLGLVLHQLVDFFDSVAFVQTLYLNLVPCSVSKYVSFLELCICTNTVPGDRVRGVQHRSKMPLNPIAGQFFKRIDFFAF